MTTKGRVLMMVADELTSRLLGAYFASVDYEVLAAATKDEALSVARQAQPKAVIIDLDVPDIDVAALCNDLRATPRTRHLHITLLTPQARRDDRLQALASGADEFMAKPVDAEELGLRLRNALRRAEFQNLVDPISGLPGPRLVEEQLRVLLRRTDDWALIRSSLRGYKAFSAAYGFLAGEEVLRFAAQALSQVVEQLGGHQDFLGHAGGDNFVVVTTPDRAEALRAAFAERFNDGVRAHYSFREREQGYMLIKTAESEERVPLMTLNTQMITSAQGPFYDLVELTQMSNS
ncbi:MAG: response regulator [Chloroflexi bacterium]|nr:response regulator [Chloroflexota bacterium]